MLTPGDLLVMVMSTAGRLTHARSVLHANLRSQPDET
jgi:hypothetical protein